MRTDENKAYALAQEIATFFNLALGYDACRAWDADKVKLQGFGSALAQVNMESAEPEAAIETSMNDNWIVKAHNMGLFLEPFNSFLLSIHKA